MAVSALMVRAIVEELQGRGFDTHELLAVCGLTSEQLTDIRCGVEGERFARLTERAIAISADPAIGLALGARTPARILQVIGYLLLASPCLRAACEGALRYRALLADTAHFELVEEGHDAVFGFRFMTPTPETTQVANDWALSLGYRILRYFAPPAAEPSARLDSPASTESIQVEVSHVRPEYAAVYARHFPRVRFRSRQTALRFPRAWLDLPSVHGDTLTSTALQAVAEDLLQSRNMQLRLSERLRARLRREVDLSACDAQALARMAGLAPSTLRRVLAEEDLSPLDLLDEARANLARAELRRNETPIKELAHRLGYADLSSFHRAFKRWTGQTPAGYREAASGR